MPALDGASLDIIFRNARTHNGWQDKPVSDELLMAVYDLFRWGPTSTNSCPGRIVFVKSKEAKAKLGPCMDKGNYEKTMAAPATAIVAYDLKFYEKLPVLSPHNNAISWFNSPGKEQSNEKFAFRNGTLQGAYFMIAARALGLDCGPMSGFSNAKVDEAFFAGTSWRSNFLCNLGYGDPSKVYPRAARLDFSEACRIE
jgi:3-hydroxypropanoate dehydrogenase